METFKKIVKIILFPHPAVIVILLPVAAALLIYSFLYLDGKEIITYISYFLSAYVLTVFCARIPHLIRFLRYIKEDNKYVKRYLTDTHLRINISLYGSLIWNIAYAVLQLGLGFYHHTVWYYALAVYYILLSSMRFFLLRHTRKHKAGEDKGNELSLYRFCGIMLLVMNLALAVIITYIVLQGRVFIHHEITTIAMAAYTFTTLTMAIINVVRYRKYESPVFSGAKVVSLSAALVSMITLESTMLTTFGSEGQESFRFTILALTGLGIILFILILAIYMIVKSTKKIKEIKNG